MMVIGIPVIRVYHDEIKGRSLHYQRILWQARALMGKIFFSYPSSFKPLFDLVGVARCFLLAEVYSSGRKCVGIGFFICSFFADFGLVSVEFDDPFACFFCDAAHCSKSAHPMGRNGRDV